MIETKLSWPNDPGFMQQKTSCQKGVHGSFCLGGSRNFYELPANFAPIAKCAVVRKTYEFLNINTVRWSQNSFFYQSQNLVLFQ
jgi:hypothetical protein